MADYQHRRMDPGYQIDTSYQNQQNTMNQGVPVSAPLNPVYGYMPGQRFGGPLPLRPMPPGYAPRTNLRGNTGVLPNQAMGYQNVEENINVEGNVNQNVNININQNGNMNPNPMPIVGPIRIVGPVPAGEINNIHTNVFQNRVQNVNQQGQQRDLEREKKEWKYIKAKMVEKGANNPDDQAGNKVSAQMKQLVALALELEADKSSDPLYNSLVQTLNEFLKKASNEKGWDENDSVNVSANMLKAVCRNYKQGHSFFLSKLGVKRKIKKIEAALNDITANLGGLTEMERAETVGSNQVDLAYTTVDNAMRNNQNSMATDFAYMLLPPASAEQQEVMNRLAAEDQALRKLKGKAKQKAKLDRDFAWACGLNANVQAVSANWTDQEKQRFVDMVKINQAAQRGLQNCFQLMENLKKVMDRNGTMEWYNTLKTESLQQMLETGGLLGYLDTFQTSGSQDKYFLATLNQLKKQLREAYEEVSQKRETLLDKNIAIQYKQITKSRPALDRKAEGLPTATIQRKAIKEKFNKIKTCPPLEMSDRFQSGQSLRMDELEQNAKDQFYQNKFIQIAATDKQLNKEAKENGWTQADIARYVTLHEMQKVARVSSDRLRDLKNRIKNHKGAFNDQEKAEIDAALAEQDRMKNYMIAVSQREESFERDSVIVEAAWSIKKTMESFKKEISGLWMSAKYKKTQQGAEKQKRLETQVKKIREYKPTFGKSGTRRDQFKENAYQKMLELSKNLQMDDPATHNQSLSQYTERLMKYNETFFGVLQLEDLTKAEFEALKKKDKIFANILLNSQRVRKQMLDTRNPPKMTSNPADTQSTFDFNGSTGTVLQVDQRFGAEMQFTDKQTGAISGPFWVYPSPLTHNRSIKWQGRNNDKGFLGTCNYASSSYAINQMLNGFDISNENSNVELGFQMGLMETVYAPERDACGEPIVKDGKIVLSKDYATMDGGGTFVKHLAAIMTANNLKSHALQTDKAGTTADQAVDIMSQELDKGNTLMITVNEGVLLYGEGDFAKQKQKLNLGETMRTDHTINVCAACYQWVNGIRQLTGFMVKDTGVNQKNGNQDADGDMMGSYDFIPVERMKLAMMGNIANKIVGHTGLVVEKYQG